MSHRHAWKEYPADRSVLFCECGAQVTWDPRDPSTHPGDCGKPDRQPAVGDITVFVEGLIVVDDVRDGEVYFRQFSFHPGAPARMTIELFAQAVAKYELLGYVVRKEG